MARHAAVQITTNGNDAIVVRKQIVADFCKLIGARLGQIRPTVNPQPKHAELPHLSPRMQQTLRCILGGDSEKQIGLKLGVSKHTVHVYVKALYRGFDVNSRSELMSKFVAGGAQSFPLPADDRETRTSAARSAG